MVTLKQKEEEEGNFTSVTIHREEWMDIAETLLKRVKNGVRPNKRQSRKMGGISSHFLSMQPNYIWNMKYIIISRLQKHFVLLVNGSMPPNVINKQP